jgi:uncharacterized membrane protein YhaH (DUF805 family)
MSQYVVAEPTLDQPYYGISFRGAFARGLRKYARFDGRASRSEFWWFTLGCIVVVILLMGLAVLATVAFGEPNGDGSRSVPVLGAVLMILAGLFYVAIVLPSLAITVRRLHDAGYSGWWVLFRLLPYAGDLVVLILNLQPSVPAGARYDLPPTRAVGPRY